MAEIGRKSPPYQAFGSIAITYAECSTRKGIKHHEHTKCKRFANWHRPAFDRRHASPRRRPPRSGGVLVVFINQFDGIEPAVVGTRCSAVGARDQQHVVDHSYVGNVEYGGFFEHILDRRFFHVIHERFDIDQFGFRRIAGLSRRAVSGTGIASATGQWRQHHV